MVLKVDRGPPAGCVMFGFICVALTTIGITLNLILLASLLSSTTDRFQDDQRGGQALLACFLFVLMLGLMTLQKMSLMTSLRMTLHPDVTMEQGYCIITLLLVTPYMFALFLMAWNIPFLRKSMDGTLPSTKSIMLGLFAAIVEAICVVTFTTRVMALLPVYVALPATHGALAISSAILSFNRSRASSADLSDTDERVCRKWSRRSLLCGGARVMASILCILASPAVSLFLYFMDRADIVTSITLAIVPSLLGLIWTPELQSNVVDPQGSNPLCHKRFCVLYGTVKIVALIIIITLEMYIRSDISQNGDLIHRFLQGVYVFKRTYALVPIVVHFATSLSTFAFSYVSLALCQPLFGVIVPSLFSIVTSTVLCVMLAPILYGIQETTYFGSFSIFLICSSVLAWAWAWPYMLNSSTILQKPNYLLTPYKVLFREYGWNPIFNDQKFLLGYDSKNQTDVLSPESKVKNRIYICTTMYREADYEMERLLMSLIQVCSDVALEGVHLESNVFIDNGCNGETLNEFALQFVALLVSKANIMLDKARCWLTPYGIQIFCKFPCGLPLFVHLKDAQKVKAKKRWSQSMYINYVMRFRKVLWQHDSDNTLKFGTAEGKISPTLLNIVQDATISQINLHEQPEQFILSQIGNVGYPTLVDFRIGTGSDHGGTSVEDSSPPNSDSGSQGFAYSSSKESSDLESLPEERAPDSPGAAYINDGFQPDDYIESNRSSNLNNVHLQNGSSFITKADACYSLDSSSYNDVDVHDSAIVDDDHTFILATDADMDFKGEAVRKLLDLCNGDKMIGAACGRTHPVGQKCSSIVWHQVFEYAKDFWMIKNAQNVIGSVSCCPGCFSLYRASAIRDVMDKYSSPTRTPFTVYVKDTGEDRWMATLMMINGWRMRYSPFADNSTYCPDSFEEYYKQRRRWILSDMANAILVVQNLFQLVRNNDCFSFVYIVYLVNMFLNNVITPGTAIVMITAGLELVFEIPYVYTTIPLATIVYTYAFLCTCTSARTQGLLTSILTVLMGSTFSSVAIYGSYKITSGMVSEIGAGHFRFQQHYVILLLTLSLVYAALMHPRESYQIIYGFAYLFIFPAMHVLLPIYSIANIIDQSWGTRDSTNAKLPKMSCIPAFWKMKKRLKKTNPKVYGRDAKNYADTKSELQNIISSLLVDMSKGDNLAREEHKFWEFLTSTRLGTDVNKGLGKSALADGLRVLRNRLLAGFLILNALWLGFLSYFYLGLDTPLSRLNIYGIISGALYGFTLIIQIVGLTVSRVEQVLLRIAKYIYKDDVPLWVHEKDMAD